MSSCYFCGSDLGGFDTVTLHGVERRVCRGDCPDDDGPGLPLDWDDVGEVPYVPARSVETVELP